MDIEDLVRKLAKSNKYQTLYSMMKESGLNMFRNSFDYTNLQVYFLTYLVFYYNLYMEIALNNVSEVVLENEIYEDAFTHYKHKTRNKDLTAPTKTENTSKSINKEKETKDLQKQRFGVDG